MTIESMPVSSYMTRNMRTETENQNIRAACKIMHENDIGAVVIVKGNEEHHDSDIDSNNYKKPIGIITERDIVKAIGSLDLSVLSAPLRDIMSKPLVTISTNSSIKDAIQTMQHKNIRRLIIVENEGVMTGIITYKDIFRAIMSNQDLTMSLLSDKMLIGDRSVYDQFGESWFSDILQRR
ncbi:MAG: CBS domain-containing protein [Nitrososphaeraceae archaeon]